MAPIAYSARRGDSTIPLRCCSVSNKVEWTCALRKQRTGEQEEEVVVGKKTCKTDVWSGGRVSVEEAGKKHFLVVVFFRFFPSLLFF